MNGLSSAGCSPPIRYSGPRPTNAKPTSSTDWEKSTVSPAPESPVRRKVFPSGLSQWIEFYWLIATNATFRAAPNKRRAYYEHRLGKFYTSPCG